MNPYQSQTNNYFNSAPTAASSHFGAGYQQPTYGDYGEKNQDFGAIAGYGGNNGYGDVSPNINNDQIYDNDHLTNDFADKLSAYQDTNYGGINKDTAYDADGTAN